MVNDCGRTECGKLFRRLEMASFAVDDVKLYLDTHPCDTAALAYYEKFRDTKKQIMQEYNNLCGPINAEQVNTANGWTWVNGPWPWEGEM